MVVLRTVFVIAETPSLQVDQMNEMTAFINRDFDDIIYMKIPECLRNEGNKK